MPRARATDNGRSRSKAALIDEISRGIEQFQDILNSIEDFSREGFPYRDAARAKAELQLRECVRRIFGERSPEFQTSRSYKLRTSNKSETALSVGVVKQLIQNLEDKKLELQGLKPPPEEPAVKPGPVPQMTLVPPTVQTGHLAVTPQPPVTPPMTVSVAMTTNLSPPLAPPPKAHAATTVRPAPPTGPVQPATPTTPSQPMQNAVVTPSIPTQQAPAPPVPPPPVPAASVPPSPMNAPALVEPAAVDASVAPITPAEAVRVEPPPAPKPPPVTQPSSRSTSNPQLADPLNEQDSLDLIRKVCLRFHAVTRQLRLRKDYRATLEVEDDYDLQDLLCALLKVEFEEVGVEEWIPPYAGGAPRSAFLLHREHIAVVAKKTRPGLTQKELADQVSADSAKYSLRDKCTTLFCFIYDPEGRIGSPKRLETDLTSVSDRYTIEVLVAPK
jgi:hypothetical protein